MLHLWSLKEQKVTRYLPMYAPRHQPSKAPHGLEVTGGQSCNCSTTQVCRRWCSRDSFAIDSQELLT